MRGFFAKYEEPSLPKINISFILKHDETQVLKKVYRDIDMQDLNDGEFADNQGFMGRDQLRKYAASIKVVPVKMPEFV